MALLFSDRHGRRLSAKQYDYVIPDPMNLGLHDIYWEDICIRGRARGILVGSIHWSFAKVKRAMPERLYMVSICNYD